MGIAGGDPSTRGTVMVLLVCLYTAVIFHIGFCSKDCAKRKNLWTTVFTPMELVQTLVPIFFFFLAHFLDLAHTSLQEASIGEP